MTALSAPSTVAVVAASTSEAAVGRYECDELALVGHVDWVEAEESACGPDRIWDRDYPLVKLDAHAGRFCELAQAGGETAAGEIAHDVHVRAGREHGGDQPVQGSSIGADLGAEFEPVTHAQYGDAVHPDRAELDDDDVAGSGSLGPDVDASRSLVALVNPQ